MKGIPEDPTKYQQYDLNLISTDLRHEELVHQIAESLDYLQGVMNDVFSKAESRVKTNRDRLAQVQHRAKVAQAKVDHLKGRKKATQVFSSAKYPVAEKLEDYNSLFSNAKFTPNKHANYKLVKKMHHAPTDDDMRNKLKFYSVQVGKKGSDSTSSEGLGRLPNNIDSVSSLLLFNTAENPYKKYVMLDPRGVVTKTRSSDDEDLTGPAEAPMTIAMGESVGQKEKETFIYRPDLGEVPLISVPDSLPDLMDVADDLVFGADLGPAIAPSAFGQEIPELPEVVPDLPAPDQPAAGASGSAPPPPPPAGGAPPPPPPPPSGAPPPPPPPPPAAAPPPPPPSAAAPPPAPVAPPAAAGDDVPSTPEPVGDDGGRGSLLAAIRNAGGAGKAGLKKAANRKMEKKKQKETPKASSGGGDLMSDLASMLTMRRRGIAGSGAKAKESSAASDEPAPVPKPQQQSEEASGGVMSKISDLIPFNPTQDDDGDDDDWE